MNPGMPPIPVLQRLGRNALIVGVIGSLAALGGALQDREQFFQSYLVAFLFWAGLALGCLGVLMLHHLVGGNWGFVIRRLCEAGASTLPLLALFFAPLAFGLHDLYLWARPEEATHDPILQQKAPYLNVPFFLIRTAIYFAVWSALSHLLNKWSDAQDREGDLAFARRLQYVSGPGLILYVFTVTFAAFDWGMSLDPHWLSTIYGLIFVVGQALAALALCVKFLELLSETQPLSRAVGPDHFHDLGNLMLAFVLLWAYMALSQFLIIWSGNLAEEVPWYIERSQGGWEWFSVLLILLHFAVPFFFLLSKQVKRNAGALALLAVGVLCMRFLDIFWLIVPSVRHGGFHVIWVDIAAVAGLGGFWLAAFSKAIQSRPLLPLNDTRFQEVAVHA